MRASTRRASTRHRTPIHHAAIMLFCVGLFSIISLYLHAVNSGALTAAHFVPVARRLPWSTSSTWGSDSSCTNSVLGALLCARTCTIVILIDERTAMESNDTDAINEVVSDVFSDIPEGSCCAVVRAAPEGTGARLERREETCDILWTPIVLARVPGVSSADIDGELTLTGIYGAAAYYDFAWLLRLAPGARPCHASLDHLLRNFDVRARVFLDERDESVYPSLLLSRGAANTIAMWAPSLRGGDNRDGTALIRRVFDTLDSVRLPLSSTTVCAANSSMDNNDDSKLASQPPLLRGSAIDNGTRCAICSLSEHTKASHLWHTTIILTAKPHFVINAYGAARAGFPYHKIIVTDATEDAHLARAVAQLRDSQLSSEHRDAPAAALKAAVASATFSLMNQPSSITNTTDTNMIPLDKHPTSLIAIIGAGARVSGDTKLAHMADLVASGDVDIVGGTLKPIMESSDDAKSKKVLPRFARGAVVSLHTRDGDNAGAVAHVSDPGEDEKLAVNASSWFFVARADILARFPWRDAGPLAHVEWMVRIAKSGIRVVNLDSAVDTPFDSDLFSDERNVTDDEWAKYARVACDSLQNMSVTVLEENESVLDCESRSLKRSVDRVVNIAW